MKIERVDDKTVKCFLSNEELEEYDIDYKDFLLRSEKAKEIVKEIMEQAVEEVGYKPPKFAFDLQIMMLPEQGLLLTFSEKEPFEGADGDVIVECLKQMKDLVQQKKNELAAKKQAGQSGAGTTAQGNGQDVSVNQQVSGQSTSGAEEKQKPDYAIFEFAKLSDILAFAKAMPNNLRIRSALYSMEDKYYLYLQKGAASYARYSRACIQALEFAALYGAEETKLLFLQEHGECLIAEKALRKLAL
ncbi:MAG: adaptor protein MecA [Lachnospiraceae bacterium]|nr:adaptor protein MecA [Lachnospiraceae bacterium]